MVKSVLLSKLHQDPDNARKHSKENLDAIKGSLKRFGQQKPIVVTKEGKILAGNGTYEAAKALKWAEILVQYTDLTGDEAKAYALADNRSSELATWDDKILGSQLLDLYSNGFDIAELGFQVADYLDEVINKNNFDEENEDEIPEVKDYRVKRGDIWLLGDHRLMCGDSTSKADVDRLMQDDKPNIMLTDPPYGVNLDLSKIGDKTNNRNKIKNDDIYDWTEAYNKFKGDVAYVWHPSRYQAQFEEGLNKAGMTVKQQIIWVKDNFVFGRSSYHWKHEPCFLAIRDGGKTHWVGDRKQTTVWEAKAPNSAAGEKSKDDRTEHPSQKPVVLYEIPIMNHTKKGDFIYDPFLGSGTAIIAAEKTGRRCLGLDLDEKYCDLIITRFEKVTGKKAEKV